MRSASDFKLLTFDSFVAARTALAKEKFVLAFSPPGWPGKWVSLDREAIAIARELNVGPVIIVDYPVSFDPDPPKAPLLEVKTQVVDLVACAAD